ncbi:MAG: cupin domain-containing protein [Granulosicoccus sp.]|nr:cupin domain-containing protein [Granulosicoccus sp.]
MSDNLAEQLFGSVSTPVFFEKFWEKTLLHVKRENPNPYSALVSTTDIERLLTEKDLFFPDIQLTQLDRPIPQSDYALANNQINPLRLLEQHRQGATLVISRAHRLLGALSTLCRQIQVQMQMRCQANVYLSPPGNQGFNAHYDTHDVVIVQVQGNKTFNFYAGGPELPFTDERFNPALLPAITLEKSVQLSAGDTLYIPRGVIHDARADDQSTDSSLHITLGLYPIVVRDLLQEMIQVVAENDAHYRQSLSGLTDFSQLGQRFSALFNDEVAGEAYSRLQDEMAIQGEQDCTGLLSVESHGQNHAGLIQVKPAMIVNVERRDQKIVLRTFGQVMEFGEPMSTAVEWILEQQRFTIAEIPTLDQTQSSALLQRLMSENIVGPV